MKILHIIPRFTTGGAERLVLEYAKHPGSNQIAVASVRAGGELTKQFRQYTDDVFVGSASFFATLKRLKAFVKKFQPDIIHTHVASGHAAGYFLRRSFKDVCWINTQHNIAKENNAWRQFCLGIMLGRADATIAVSPAVANDCAHIYGLSKESVIYIPNGIDVDTWSKVSQQELLSKKRLRIATIGRLKKQKGHDILIAALALFSQSDWDLHIFGVGEWRDRLQARVRELGLWDRVHWHGVSDDLPADLDTVDIVVQPSRWEGMSLVVMEAMVAGRVVIATEAAGVGLIEHEKTGHLVKTDDMRALADALFHIDSNRTEAKRLAKEARRYGKEHFGIKEHIEKVNRVYKSVCGAT